MFSTPAYWNGFVYLTGQNQGVTQFAVDGGQLDLLNRNASEAEIAGWVAALDLEPSSARALAARAHAAGLINFRTIGDAIELDVAPLERLN